MLIAILNILIIGIVGIFTPLLVEEIVDFISMLKEDR